MSTRRSLLLACAAAVGASVQPRALRASVAADHGLLPQPASLGRELATALAAGKALVVLVSLERCPWCQLVRASHLAPLRAAGQPVVQVEMGRSIRVTDFQGVATTHGELVRTLGVQVAPTVLFIGRGGREHAPRLAGVPLPDFYGAYLQERLDTANGMSAA